MSTDASGAHQRVVVGRIGPAHGISGDVFVQPLTDVPEIRFAAGRTLQAGPPVTGELVVAHSKDHSGKLVVRFEGIHDRSAAESLRGAELEVDVDPFERPSDSEEYFDRQLIGLRVVDAVGELLGTVSDVVHLPAQDLLAVRLVSGDERLVPFVKQIVPNVDLERGELLLEAPLGLLSDLDEEGPRS